MTPKDSMNLDDILEGRIQLINAALDFFLPSEEEYPQNINRAMRYSVFAGGKRIRPLLILLTAELFDFQQEKGLIPAAAIEMIHTYSLIHDDLPAMDDDDYRRGRLTSHKVFGGGLAILAGDALLTLAFEILSREVWEAEGKGRFADPYLKSVPAETRLKIIYELSQAAGVGGMVGGQVIDLESEGKSISPGEIDYINSHKTGALLVACFRMGALLGGGGEDDLKRLTASASALGSAFQVVDDLLDLEGNEEKMGKSKGADIKQKKATYLALYGPEKAKQLRDENYEEARLLLDYYGAKAEVLQGLARFMLYRDY